MKARNRRVDVRVIQAPAAPAAAPVVAVPNKIRVKVLSGPTAGIAGILVVNSLKKNAVNVVKQGKTPSPPAVTTIEYAAGAKAEAERIAGMISVPGGTTVVQMPKRDPDAEVVVTLGAAVK